MTDLERKVMLLLGANLVPSFSLHQIARHLQVPPQAIAPVLSNLRQKGLCYRKDSTYLARSEGKNWGWWILTAEGRDFAGHLAEENAAGKALQKDHGSN